MAELGWVGQWIALIEFDPVYPGALGAQHVLVHAGRFAADVLQNQNVLLGQGTPGAVPSDSHEPVVALPGGTAPRARCSARKLGP